MFHNNPSSCLHGMTDAELKSPLLTDMGTPETGPTLHGIPFDPIHLRSFTCDNVVGGGGTGESSMVEPPQPTSSLSLDEGTGANPVRVSILRRAAVSLSRRGWHVYYAAKARLGRKVDTEHDSDGEAIPGNNEDQWIPPPRPTTLKSSLSSSPSTHILLKLLLPPLILTNHILFYHAQTKPMWNLSYNIDVAVNATASTLKSKASFDVLNLPHQYEFVKRESRVVETFTYMDAIRKLWKGEGLGDAQTISKISAALLVLFSGIWPHLKLLLVHVAWFFPFGHRLQASRHCNDDETGRDRQKPQRVGCCGNTSFCETNTFCYSNGHSHRTYTARSPFLRTLSILGKWSLADVLVVCILIAVLHLDWHVHLEDIRSGVEKKLPTILSFVRDKYPDEVKDCEQLLKYECRMGHALVIHYPACLACETLIKNAFYHPEWTVGEGKDILDGITLEGGGYAQLRVVGMIGTYFFCGAVIMSILLSLIVDGIDELDRTHVEQIFLSNSEEKTGEIGSDLRLTANNPPTQAFLDHPGIQRHANAGHNPLAARSVTSGSMNNSSVPLHHPLPSPTTNSRLLKQTMMIVLSLISLPLVCFAVSLPTMERLVYGGLPTLLHEVLGMVWKQDYSLISLVATTGDAGGWDTFLMVTFGMFVVIGPLLRSLALTLHVIFGLPVALLGECIEQPRRRTSLRMLFYQLTSTIQKALRPFIDATGAFCSWEVLIIALLMIQAEMPSITDTIHEDDRCMEADPEHGRTCIEVQFNAKDNFLLICIAWAVLIAASSFVCDLAVSEEDNLSLHRSKRYEYGMAIPRRTRANLSSDQSWKGALRDLDISDSNSAMGEQVTYSPLQQHQTPEEVEPLEEIVFV
eukprot:CCRYP_016696-RA/>CCRYP_016696-RA protein AED:0.24 eAED:0.24 QI:216/1/1/1/0.8/0.66/6/786/860